MSTCLPLHGPLLTWVRGLGENVALGGGGHRTPLMSGNSPAWHVDRVSQWKVALYQGCQLLPSPVFLWWRLVSGACSTLPWQQPRYHVSAHKLTGI